MASTLPDVCFSCGKERRDTTATLKKCSQCKYSEYCSRDCQIEHWKAGHREECSVAKKLTDAGHGKEEIRTKLKEKEMKKYRKEIRQRKEEGSRVVNLSFTAEGCPVPPNFALKQIAHSQFVEFAPGSIASQKLGNMKREDKYKNYFDGVVEHKEEWMLFYSHPHNYEHVEHTCGIFGTLATIYRQRGNLVDCRRILDLEDEILVLYEGHAAAKNIPDTTACFETLRYKCRHVRFNLNNQQELYQENIPLFRHQMDYEFRYNVPFDGQEYLFFVQAVLKKKVTAKAIRRLTDKEILKMIMAPVALGVGPTSESNHQRVALMRCGKCNVEEKYLRQFPACSRCGKTHYCCKDCQVTDWKSHKAACQAKKA